MNNNISPNTQAVLLLTAPLIVGKSERSQELLALGEYNLLEQALLQNGYETSDLLGSESNEIIDRIRGLIEKERLTRLLGRGFLLSQAVERWQTRSIWVVSRDEQDYPERVKVRLKGAAPAVFYGCGDATILRTGGLAIVGSRHVDTELIEYTESIGQLVARADKTVISGGARGIDQAAMRSALQAEGQVIGVLADSLEQLALNRDSREYLMNKQLVLISAYDPSAGFNVGNAMNRNKIIYSLADAALVVSSDYESGGTWAGAIEQLGKLRFVPVYVRSEGIIGKGLTALLRKGARPWPNPSNPDGLDRVFTSKVSPVGVTVEQSELPLTTSSGFSAVSESSLPFVTKRVAPVLDTLPASRDLADELFAKVRDLLREIKTPKTTDEVAVELNISKVQAGEWLKRLVDEGTLQKISRPVRFFPMSVSQRDMFKRNIRQNKTSPPP